MSCTSLHSDIPFQVLYNRKPDYAFLRIFACAIYPLLRPYDNHKFSFNSKQCVFLGYSPQHLGNRCLDIDNDRIYYARHVQFDESIFPFKTSHLQSAHGAPIFVAGDASIWISSPGLIHPHLQCSNISGNAPVTTLSPYNHTPFTSPAKLTQTPALSSSTSSKIPSLQYRMLTPLHHANHFHL